MSYLSLIVAIFGLAVSQGLVFASDEVTTNATVLTSDKKHDLPLYFVNGTSKTTGKPIVCILAEFKAEFNLAFMTKYNKTATNRIYVIPDDAVVNKTKSYCTDTVNVLRIDFKFGEASPKTNPYSHLELIFAKNAEQVFLFEITYAFHNLKSVYEDSKYDDFYGGNTNRSYFQTSPGYSYYCESPEAFNFRGTLLTLTDMRLEAFRTEDTNLFSKAENCKVPKHGIPSNSLGIALGCTFGAIIFVGLLVGLYYLNKKYQFYNQLSRSVSNDN